MSSYAETLAQPPLRISPTSKSSEGHFLPSFYDVAYTGEFVLKFEGFFLGGVEPSGTLLARLQPQHPSLAVFTPKFDFPYPWLNLKG